MQNLPLTEARGKHNPFSPDFLGYPDELPCHIEFFRPESLRPIDADGYEIDSATREIAEIDAFFAAQADVEWLNTCPLPYQATDEDWADYRAWSEHLDRLEAIRAAEDADFEASQRFGGSPR